MLYPFVTEKIKPQDDTKNKQVLLLLPINLSLRENDTQMPLATMCICFSRCSAVICEACQKNVSVSYSQLTGHHLLGGNLCISWLTHTHTPFFFFFFPPNEHWKENCIFNFWKGQKGPLPSRKQTANAGSPQNITMSFVYLQAVFLTEIFDKTACRRSLYPEIVSQYPSP